jgi:hypothetical protein
MKLFCILFLAVVDHVAAAEPLFYVLDVRHTGDAVIHASSKTMSPTAALPYVVVNAPAMECCVKVGPKPGQRKPPVKIDEDAPRLSSEGGEETFQFPAYASIAPTGARSAADTLAFGLVGMTAVSAKGKRTYKIMMSGSAKPVVVRHCLGAEGVNFRLYHHAEDKPFATYYYSLGYDIVADCR